MAIMDNIQSWKPSDCNNKNYKWRYYDGIRLCTSPMVFAEIRLYEVKGIASMSNTMSKDWTWLDDPANEDSLHHVIEYSHVLTLRLFELYNMANPYKGHDCHSYLNGSSAVLRPVSVVEEEVEEDVAACSNKSDEADSGLSGVEGQTDTGASLDIRVVKSVKSADGRVLRKPVEVRERWEEFPRREAEEEQPTEGPIPPWTQEEVHKAIGKMKLGKAAGPDDVPAEAWKVLGDLGINWLTQFLNRITKEGRMPDDWRNSTIVPIFK
ncbi:unnamed protein product [Heligmosomoides polygyrus]|uniref:Polyprotein n=1 Tax=Heligmosomoides polygyrus TaxID=6339 RepID=A0A3P8C0M6_HELPZ|nr:unnamed protein product [Heligmosomoides polygyrus]